MAYNGIDLFRPDPGTVESYNCLACGSLMNVERDIKSSNSFAGAMCGLNRKHDLFTCSKSNEDWHQQVVGLMLEQKKTKSAKISKILQEEIEEILSSEKVTKKIGWW